MNREDAKVREFVYNYGRGKITLGAISNVKIYTYYLVKRGNLYAEYYWATERWVFVHDTPQESSFIVSLSDAEELAGEWGGKVKKVTIIEEEDTE